MKEKNNGFAGNDRPETRIFVYLVDFVQFLPEANFAGGAFEDSPDWDNICKIAPNYPHFFFDTYHTVFLRNQCHIYI